jgi:hypothetical protein
MKTDCSKGGTKKLRECLHNDTTDNSKTLQAVCLMYANLCSVIHICEDIYNMFCDFLKWEIQENKEFATSFISILVKSFWNTWHYEQPSEKTNIHVVSVKFVYLLMDKQKVSQFHFCHNL